MSLILEWLASLMPHLMLAPIVLPMLTAALMLLLKEEQQDIKMVLDQQHTSNPLGPLAPGGFRDP